MNLNLGDIVVVDTNVLITRKRSGRICERIINSGVRLAVSDKLLDECYRNVAKTGWSPVAFKELRLRCLEKHRVLIHKKDEDLRKIIPNHMPDHHIGNLALTVGARIVISLNKKHKPILERYGLLVVNPSEFADCA